MYKLLLIWILVLTCMSPLVNAQTYYSGNSYVIDTIEVCEGPIFIKATSEEGIKEEELSIASCNLKKLGSWECDCNNGFDINISTANETLNMYDFTIQYYVEYRNFNTGGSREPSLDQIEYENNIRTKRIIDVLITPEKKRFDWGVEVEMGNVIMVTIIITLAAIGIFVFGGRKYIGKRKEVNPDMFNYRVKQDDDITDNEILNNIK